MYGTILAAIDTTPEGERVLQQATGLARATGSRVHVLHVRAEDVYDGAATVVEEDADAARAFVEKAVKELADGGVTADGEVDESLRPALAQVVLETAQRVGAGLVVLGTRRHGAFSSLFTGSVSDGVVHHATLPVLLVP